MKRLLLVIAIMAVLLAPVWAQSENDFEVTQNADNTITITGYKGRATAIVIPETLFGLRVTAIGNQAFADKRLTSVVIPNSVITIGNFAFSGNQLTSITLGNSITTINSGAFSGNRLTEITIPDSVISIGGIAFTSGNAGTKGTLRKVTLGRGLKTIHSSAFENNQITELNLPSSLETIRSGAFANNQITILTLPASLKIIGEDRDSSDHTGAFEGNQIRYLNIPNNGIKIGVNSFCGKYYGGNRRNMNPIEALVVPPSLAGGMEYEPGSGMDGRHIPVFLGLPITFITLPANMNERFMRENFEAGLINFWNSQNKAAGSYLKRGPIWAKITDTEATEYINNLTASNRGQTQSSAPATSTGGSSTTTSSTTVSTSAIAPTLQGWVAHNDTASSSSISIANETINGAQKEVITIQVNVGSGTASFAGISNENEDIIQRLRTANGVRFKVQGDGKRWRVQFLTSDVTEKGFHGIVINPRANRITDVDVPFSRVRQPSEWGGNARFNKANITVFSIERQIQLTGGGSSTIKIFDIEIY